MTVFNIKVYNLIALIAIVLLLLACGSTQGGKKSKTKSGFVSGDFMTQDETFSGISSNIGRLHAMLAGEYVQYNNNGTSGREKGVYGPWMVNDGKDSVILYSIPVGDPNKIGYWMYHYQIMTSLPDEPIYVAFEEFIEVDRDTIKSVFYEVPSDFKPTLESLKKQHRASFDKVKLDQLQVSVVSEKITYIRQNPLFFTGETPIIENQQRLGFFKSDYYEIKPSGILYRIKRFEKDKKKIYDTQDDKFIKLSMVK